MGYYKYLILYVRYIVLYMYDQYNVRRELEIRSHPAQGARWPTQGR